MMLHEPLPRPAPGGSATQGNASSQAVGATKALRSGSALDEIERFEAPLRADRAT